MNAHRYANESNNVEQSSVSSCSNTLELIHLWSLMLNLDLLETYVQSYTLVNRRARMYTECSARGIAESR